MWCRETVPLRIRVMGYVLAGFRAGLKTRLTKEEAECIKGEIQPETSS
jgi:hypothetical protein